MKQFLTITFLMISLETATASGNLHSLNEQSAIKVSPDTLQHHLKKGYLFAIESGYHFGIGKVIKSFDYGLPLRNNNEGALAVQIINSYRFNETLSMGIGAGFHKYEEFESLPVFLDVRLLFPSQNKTAAFLSMQVGTVFPSVRKIESEHFQGTDIKHSNGFMVSPNLGLRIGKASAFVLNVGYMVYFRKEHHSGYHYFFAKGTRPVNQDIKTLTSYFTVRIGMMIN